MEHGPVDVLVVATTEPRFEGGVLFELEKAASTGAIKVLDAMLLAKSADGTRMSIDMEDLPAEDKAALGFIETGTRGLFDSDDADALWEGMVPGSVIIALAVENAWAVPVINALADAGAELALHTRIPAVLVDDALAALGQ